ncbi:hypothetical protein CTheo_7165 [Ceratobasidium theobromae]|uniref:Uncharacterized protein n=1 Tax=Ceratobasidium theobromae TaxID=1582974 RepID=A0A5N5QD72_9AGAM|nr:hypothetical protein CTheo_7165 [Ceratobasidium theobromae]
MEARLTPKRTSSVPLVDHVFILRSFNHIHLHNRILLKINADLNYLVAAASIINAQHLPPGIDPRCKKMDNDQWDSFVGKEAIRKRAFARDPSQLGLPPDRAFTEVLFGHENKAQLNDNWFCGEGWNTSFERAKQLQCRYNTINLLDKSNNAPGTITVSVWSGTSSSTTVTETNESATAAGVMVKMAVSVLIRYAIDSSAFLTPHMPALQGKIPLVGAAETTVSFTQTYTKTFGKSQTFQTSTITTVSRAIEVGKANSKCTASMTTTTCQHESKGKYPIIALGWVGWRLKDEHTHKGQRARRWYVFIDGFPRAERQDFGTVNARISSETYATVISHCDSGKRDLSVARAERLSHSKSEIEAPIHAYDRRDTKAKLASAKAALPDKLKAKVIEADDALLLPVDDDDDDNDNDDEEDED